MTGHQLIGGVMPFLKLREGRWTNVYKAYDASLERYVLLKVLNRETAGNHTLAQQFEAEARLMAKVQHPHIVPVLSYGNENDATYLITAFVDGYSLREMLTICPKIPVVVSVQMLYDMAMGLQAAHQQDILHRDLKPANVMLSAEGHIQITDFGMASLKASASQKASEQQDVMPVKGTLAYLAPELILGASPTPQSDLFSLGTTFYEMLAGRSPFRGENTSGLFDNILHYDPIPLLVANTNIPGSVTTLCAQLLAKDPANRIQSTNELIQIISEIRRDWAGVDGPEHLKQFARAPETYEAPILSAPAAKTEVSVQKDSSDDEVQKAMGEDRKPVPANKENAHGGWFSRPALVSVPFLLLIITALLYFSLSTPDEQLPNQSLPQTTAMTSASNIASEAEPEDTELSAAEIPLRNPSSEQEPAQVKNEVTNPEISSREKETIKKDSSLFAHLNTEIQVDTLTTDAAPPLDNRPGAVRILCTPWCEVEIDGNAYGQAPPAILATLAPGTYELTLSNPHYPTYTRPLTIHPASEDSLQLAFKDLVGTLELEVFPWAEVIIDSVSYGTIPPAQTIVLLPGEHTLTLNHDDLGSWSTRLIVAAGEHRRQPYNLQELIKNSTTQTNN